MSKRKSLRAYQDSILEKMEAARSSDVGQMQLLFGFSAAGKNFLISGKDILEMASPTKLEPMPVAKPWAVGAANVKGSVYSVTDFSALMGSELIKAGKFLLLAPELMAGAALRIESFNGLYELKDLGSEIEDAGMKTQASFITSYHEIAGERHYLVDSARLAVDAKFSKLQSGEI